MSAPFMSVVIPLHDHARYVGEALASVRAQTIGEIEVIVVENASSDRGPEIVRRDFPEVELLSLDHGDAGLARNAGAAASHGDFLTFLDADDQLTPGALAIQLSHFEARPDLEAVIGAVEEFISPDADDSEREAGRRPLPARTARLPGAVLMRRDAFERVGPFSAAAIGSEVVDWFARAADVGLVTHQHNRVVLRRRLHGANRSSELMRSENAYLRTLRSTIVRRRAGDRP